MKIYNNIKHQLLIKNLKKLCFYPSYFAGCEIYRLLNYNILPKMADNIIKGKVKLDSNLLFGRYIISAEEQFIYTLNKYIVFIRANIFVPATELVDITEETLKSKYSSILYSHLDYNSGNNPFMFQLEFKRMFIDSIFTNYKRFYLEYNNPDLLNIAQLNIDDEEDANKLFEIFKQMINKRHSNLYYCFVNIENDTLYEEQFYIGKWQTFINSCISNMQ